MRSVTLLAFVLAAALAAPAGAAVTASQITTPDGYTRHLNEGDGGSLLVEGTVTGTGDVELRCYHGDQAIPMGGPITPTGATFSKSLSFEDVPTVPCVVRAIPKGTNPAARPGTATPFAGVELAISKTKRQVVGTGPNTGKVVHTHVDHVLPGASGAQFETGGCGLAQLAFIRRPGLERLASPWGCQAYLWLADDGAQSTRSQIVVDGRDAYLPVHLLSGELYPDSHKVPGVPEAETNAALTPDGGLRYDDAAPALRCASDAYPPTAATCGTVAGTGVEIRRSARITPDGREVAIVDELRSTDGAAHHVDLLYENNPVGQAEIRLPGDTFRRHPKGTRVPLPAGPGTLLVRDGRPPAMNPVPLQGALTWQSAPSAYHQYRDTDFQLAFARTVPAGGSTSIVQVLSTAETPAQVEALAAGVRARLAAPIQTPPGSTPVPAPGAPGPAAPSTRDLTPPRVGGLRVTPRRFRVGTRARVSWRVSEAGRTTLVFERKRGKRFVAAGRIIRDGATGARSLTLGRKVGRRTLVPGNYRLRVRAADRAGNVTPRSTDVRFTVLRRRR